MFKFLIIVAAIFIFCIFFTILFRKEISKFINEIGWLKTKWFELKRIRKEVYAKAKEVKELAKKVEQDEKNLKKATKVFLETLYLSLETRNIFPIPQLIKRRLERNINLLAQFSEENDEERRKWHAEIRRLLDQSSKITKQ